MTAQLVLDLEPEEVDEAEAARLELALRPWRMTLPPAALHPAYPSPNWFRSFEGGQVVLVCQQPARDDDGRFIYDEEGEVKPCGGVIPDLEVLRRVHKGAHLSDERYVHRPVRPPLPARRRTS